MSTSLLFNSGISFFEVILSVDSEFPSEKDVIKNGLFRNFVTIKFIKTSTIITKVIEAIKKTTHKSETAAAIPSVIAQKYEASSRGERTGFLNLTIDKAPTIPKDKAIFPEITLGHSY